MPRGFEFGSSGAREALVERRDQPCTHASHTELAHRLQRVVVAPARALESVEGTVRGL
jgi:hypothetical protein